MGATRPAGRGLILLAMTVANGMVLVDQTAVPLILPDIITQFAIGSQQAQWVINASLLPLAGLLVFGGRLSDVVGRRRVFIVGSAVFAGASACAGLAPTYPLLLVFRALQGAGGALMLPTTIAIVSATYSGSERGRALGTMGGAAAVAGAFGPVLGGALTTTLGWRSVLLINVPLAILAILAALRAVPADRAGPRPHIDLVGTVLLTVTLIGVVLGLTQSQVWGWGSAGVLLSLALSVAALVGFVVVERRSSSPLLDIGLLRRNPNYRGAVTSQGLCGMVELGIGVLLPLLLILNLDLDPGLAGLALIPTTLPMIAVAPLAGRWYDRVGGRAPLACGFVLLAVAGLALALGVHWNSYWVIFPGLFVLGVGLALVLTVNDPVTLDTLPESSHGQASGVSATAEQFGGAIGIAVLFIVFHTTYLARLHANIDASPLRDLTGAQYVRLNERIEAAEQTGLNPTTFDSEFRSYLGNARDAANWGFSVAFFAVAVLSVLGAVVIWRLVRAPVEEANAAPPDGQTAAEAA